MARRFRVSNRKRESVTEQSLLGLVEAVELGDGELDEIADLEVGQRYNLDSMVDIERIE